MMMDFVHGSWLYDLGSWLGNISWMLAIAFVLSYGLLFKWWVTPQGRSIMVFVSMVVALSTLSLASRLFGVESDLFVLVRALTYLFAMVASGMLLWTLWLTWLKQPKDGKQVPPVVSGEPTPRGTRLDRKEK